MDHIRGGQNESEAIYDGTGYRFTSGDGCKVTPILVPQVKLEFRHLLIISD